MKSENLSGSSFYHVVLIPAAVFLSVIFGGSYGSGQELVQFITSAGPTGGYVALGAILFAWTLLLGLSFEVARLFNTYEYSGFMGVLLWKAGFVYEIVILLSMILVLAICASGAGTVLGEHFGVSVWIGSAGLLAVAVVLNYFGRAVVERSMVFSIVALLSVLAVLFFVALRSSSIGTGGAIETANPLRTGFQYAIVNGGFIPLLLYCGRGVRSRSQSFLAGFCAALAAVIPGILIHTSFLRGYPEVLDQNVPTYWIISKLMSPGFLTVYVLVLFVMITQTAVGMVQGLVDRADSLSEARRGAPLSRLGHASVAGGMIVASMLLSSVGFVALIAQGYKVLGTLFLAIFVVPLLVRGIYLIWRQTA